MEPMAPAKNKSLLLTLLTFNLVFPACVPVQMPQPDATPGQQPAQAFADIEPGGTSITTLHFTVRGYNETDLRNIGALAESIYDKIGRDTGLYSFLAGGNYNLVVYRDQSEYQQKTHQPSWSRAVTASSSIYTYPGSDLDPMLAHEMTHLVFNAYMGDKALTLRWLNEGLAMYEEVSKMTGGDLTAWQQSVSTQLKANAMPFTQMTFFTPLTEERRRTELWYQQVESVVAFMLAQGSSLTFGNFLTDLRSGTDADRALANNYPGKFRNLADLETSWKAVL